VFLLKIHEGMCVKLSLLGFSMQPVPSQSAYHKYQTKIHIILTDSTVEVDIRLSPNGTENPSLLVL
jgi:hypothetical protein